MTLSLQYADLTKHSDIFTCIKVGQPASENREWIHQQSFMYSLSPLTKFEKGKTKFGEAILNNFIMARLVRA